MSLTPWLSAIRARCSGAARRRNHAGCIGWVEVAESRCLPSVNVLVIGNTVEVTADADDTVIVGAAAGLLLIRDGNGPLNSFGSVSAASVESLVITGSDSDNVIDLSGVTATDFLALTSISVEGNDGADLITGSPDLPNLLNGEDGQDTLTGGSANDTLDGHDGDDSITAGDGDDSVFGGDGQDTIEAGNGNDTVNAGYGADAVDLGSGDDSALGSNGEDTINGGAGNDTINGDGGADSINGDAGDDRILGGELDDSIFGGSGNDTVDAQAGNDVVSGDDGDDSLAGGVGLDSINGGAGNDTLNGGADSDVLTGDDGNDSLLGGAGNDTMRGLAGDDTIRGQSGNDSLEGGAGNDSLFGDAGADIMKGDDLQIVISDVTQSEGNSGTTDFVFTISLSEVPTETVTVSVATADGIAVAGQDYNALNTTVTFAPGETSKTVTVQVIGDTVIEGHKMFFVNLSNPVNASLADAQAQGTLLDDETPTNFLGSTINDSGFIPPDTMGTVGPNHVVEMLNGVFAIYDKQTGSLISRVSLDAFWQSTGVAGPFGTFDPRIIYDHATGRFFAASINGGAGNSIFLAVSLTSDPTQGFRGVRFVGDTINGTRFNDYDTLSLDANGVYLATNNFGGPSGFDVSVYSIPKADLMLPTPSVARLTRFEALNFGQYGGSIQVALDFGPSDGTATMLGDLSGSSNLRQATITGSAGAGATLSASAGIAVPTYNTAPPGDQPGGARPLENVSTRFTGNIVEQGNSIWAVHAVLDNVTGNSAIRWYEIDEAANTVIQTGLLADPNLDFLDPSISVNQFGTVVIGATGTGLNQVPSTYAFTGLTSGGVTTFGGPTLLAQGNGTQSFGGRNRWGDYSATVRDPNNPTVFWAVQQRTAGNNIWGVQFTQIFTPVPGGAAAMFTFGNDVLVGGDGDDYVIAGPGDDFINAQNGNDVVHAGDGNDSVLGGSGNDSLNGGDGNDTLRGQGGNDLLYGEAGDDVLEWFGLGDGDDTLANTDGYDMVNASGTSAANVFTVGQTAAGEMFIDEGGATLTIGETINNVTLNLLGGADSVTIGALNNVAPTTFVVNGGVGDDVLSAFGVSMGGVRLRLNGEAGNDSLTGSTSDDTIDGGDGVDTGLGGLGNDLLLGGADVDRLNGQEGDDSIDGGDGNDVLRGFTGNDSIRGEAGDDSVFGGDGNDTVMGGAGSDSMMGEAGDDWLFGEALNDTINGGDGNDRIDGGTEADSITGDLGDDSIRGGHGADTIDGGDGNDSINGGDGNDSLTGGNGNDAIDADDGNDVVNGNAGNDSILGGDGADILLGGAGNDIMLGQDGDDTMNGQGGVDTLSTGEGTDVINDATFVLDESFAFPASLLAALV